MVVRLKYSKAIGVINRLPQDVAKKFQLISSYFTLQGFDLRSYSNLRVGDAADVGSRNIQYASEAAGIYVAMNSRSLSPGL